MAIMFFQKYDSDFEEEESEVTC